MSSLERDHLGQEEDVYHTVDDDEALSVDLTNRPLSQCPDQRLCDLATHQLSDNRIIHFYKGKVAGNDAQWGLQGLYRNSLDPLPPELLLSKIPPEWSPTSPRSGQSVFGADSGTRLGAVVRSEVLAFLQEFTMGR